MFAKIQRIHFVGIGGIGMSGIAEVLLTLGYKVSGSDLKSSSVTERLAEKGAIIFEGHRPENITSAEVVVASSAIRRDNPEITAAHAQHVPVIQRAEMLAELMRLKYGIAVAGMHGKTTTTSMVAAVLAAGGLDPTVVVGGRVDAMGSNARLGKSQYLVAEADESDRSFLKLSPILSVVTDIFNEHMDCYRDMRDVRRTFLEFMERVPFYGLVVGCHDDLALARLFRGVDRRFQFKGKAADISVIDDYGHHPTEIRATLAAARQCGFRRVHVIFQPHRFTRTRDLMDEFTTAFADADTLCLLDIYPASEEPLDGITSEVLTRRIAGAGKRSVTYAPSFSDAVAAVAALAQPGDMVLTLGAGRISQLASMILAKLATRSQE